MQPAAIPTLVARLVKSDNDPATCNAAVQIVATGMPTANELSKRFYRSADSAPQRAETEDFAKPRM